MLELTNVACERGGRRLFSAVSLKLGGGELLRVHGANGAGKTSLLRMLCGLMEPTEGQILWRSQKIMGLREEFGHELIYLGHAAALKDDLSPTENLQVACTLARQATNPEAVRCALLDAGLRGHENTLVRRLSQGQRKRSALARLVLANAAHRLTPLWVLDEPFNALDSMATAWLVGLMQSHLQRQGMVVLTSHQSVPLGDTPQQFLSL
jgi:heme exporter protein A